MLDPNSPFGELMQEAVKLKGAQQQKNRVLFDSWPQYFQNSMFMPDNVTGLRNKSFEESYEGALAFKASGTEYFRRHEYDIAYSEYEKTIAVFKYCVNLEKDWKKKGIQDHRIKTIDYKGETDEQKQAIRQLLLSCYLNIAMCQIKLNNYRLCIKSCNDALLIDPNNVKALYRRALALIEPQSSGATEYDMALQDLERANQLDPVDPTIKKLIRDIKENRMKSRETDKKTFNGLFNRGSIVDAVSTEKSNSENMKDVEKHISEAETICKHYESQGRMEEATQLRDKINQIRESSQNNTKHLDFLNPTKEMIHDAEKNGIDLNDIEVRKMLHKLQEEKENEASLPKDRIPISINRMMEDPTAGVINSMKREDLIKLLQAEGIRCDDIKSDEELKKRARFILATTMSKAKSDQESPPQSYKWGLVILGIGIIYRLYSLGMFRPLITLFTIATQDPTKSNLEQ